MKYITVCEENLNDFDSMISDYLASGYELYGNPYPAETYYCQALIKKEEEKTDV